MRQILFVLRTLVLAAVAANAQADSNETILAMPTSGSTASFCGTVVQLVETGCIGVKPSQPGQPIYEITSASPSPNVGDLVSGSGTVGGLSFCMQGPHLQKVTWKKVDVCALIK